MRPLSARARRRCPRADAGTVWVEVAGKESPTEQGCRAGRKRVSVSIQMHSLLPTLQRFLRCPNLSKPLGYLPDSWRKVRKPASLQSRFLVRATTPGRCSWSAGQSTMGRAVFKEHLVAIAVGRVIGR